MASLSPVASTAINPIPYTAPAPLPHPQILLVLAGVVGSGKSTLAHAIAAQLPNWSRVNQDDLGDRRACEAMVRLYLSQGRNVVLDRTNFDISQRKTWFDIAREFPSVSVRGMVMGTTTDECYERLLLRKNHPTIQDVPLAISLLNKFLDMWVAPTQSEGFDHLITLPSLPDTPQLTAPLLNSLLLALSQSPKAPVRRTEQPRRTFPPPKQGGPPVWGGAGRGNTGHAWGSSGRTLGDA